MSFFHASTKDWNCGFLELIVDEDYRRMGVGNFLIDSSVNLANKNRCFRIRPESDNKRKDAHKFYKKI
ncbi:MAG: GNAT family N-acetyltransferase [Thaumarchaeota archaeon]|nr:GNAT family N-acetyltransferase [Nitrososphaerota archaeon]